MFLLRGNIQKHQGISDSLKKSNRPQSLEGLPNNSPFKGPVGHPTTVYFGLDI